MKGSDARLGSNPSPSASFLISAGGSNPDGHPEEQKIGTATCVQRNFLKVWLNKRSKKIIITHGFLKKSNIIPVGEIERAERIMQDFLQRYKRGEIEL